MIPVSEKTISAYTSDVHKFNTLLYFPDHTDCNLTNEYIVADSLELTESIAEGEFKLGSVVASEFVIEFARDSAIKDQDIRGWDFYAYHYDDSSVIYGNIMNPATQDMLAMFVLDRLICPDGYNLAKYEFALIEVGVGTLWSTSLTVYAEDEQADDITTMFRIESGHRYYMRKWTYYYEGDEDDDPTYSYQEDLYNGYAFEDVPLGHYYVESCPIESNKPTRTLTAYDVIYSASGIDDTITAEDGTIALNDMLEEVDERLGTSFASAKTGVDLAFSMTDDRTIDDTEYSWDLWNGCKFKIATKTTTVTVTDSFTYNLDHKITWRSADAEKAYKYYFDKLYSTLGIDYLKYAFPALYEASSLVNLEEGLSTIFHPAVELDENGTFEITRFDYATSGDNEGAKKFIAGDALFFGVENTIGWDFIQRKANDTRTSKARTGKVFVKSYEVLSSPTVYKTWTLPIMGRSIKVELQKCNITLDCTQCRPYSDTSYLRPEVDFETWIKKGYLLALRDALVEWGYATVETSEEDDDWHLISFYNDSEYTQRDAYYAMGEDIISSLTNSILHNSFGSLQYKYMVDGTYIYDYITTTYYGSPVFEDSNPQFYVGRRWDSELLYEFNETVLLNIPLCLNFKNMGYFEEDYSVETIEFTNDGDPETGNTFWDEQEDISKITEYRYVNTLAGLSLLSDGFEFTPRQVLEAWAEINGMSFKVDRYGIPQLIRPQVARLGMYPAENLYPEDDLYPATDDAGIEDRIITAESIRSLTSYSLDTPIKFKGVQLELADGWEDPVIYDEDADESAQIYSCSNLVTLNFRLSSGDDETLFKKPIRDAIWETIKDIEIRSFDAEIVGMPYIETGDGIGLVTNDLEIGALMMRRIFKGINVMTDSLDNQIG